MNRIYYPIIGFLQIERPMQDTSIVTDSYFINFTCRATAVLNCTKELIIKLHPNRSYCEMRYYIKEDDLFKNSLEIQIDKAILLCYFDEIGICDAGCFITKSS